MALKRKLEYVGAMRTQAEREQAIDLASRSFSTYENMTSHLGRVALADGTYDPELTRIVRADGKVVAAVVMTPRTVRFGPARVSAVSIGPICTDSRYRKRGYASVGMRDAVRLLRERGFLIAYLGGIPNFYHRFGFYPYRWSYSLKVRATDAIRAGASGRLRKLAPRDRQAASRLYSRVFADRLCSADRGADLWDCLLVRAARHSFWLFNNPRALLDARGRFIGYFTSGTSGETLSCQETVVEPRVASFRSALGAIGRLARKSDKATVEFWMPPDDPLAAWLAAHVPTRIEMGAHPTGGPLMCVVSFGSLMAALKPLFEQRLRESEYVGKPLALTLRSGDGAVGLSWRARSEKRDRYILPVGPSGAPHKMYLSLFSPPARGPVASVPPRYLSGVLTGFYDVRAVAAYQGVLIPERLLRPMSILFPVGHAMVVRGDDM